MDTDADVELDEITCQPTEKIGKSEAKETGAQWQTLDNSRFVSILYT